MNEAGATYDAAGNLTKDPNGSSPQHTYTYDADGNLTEVDGGSTGEYYYDSLKHRVQRQDGLGTYDLVFDQFGRRTAQFISNQADDVNIYSDTGPIAFRTDGQTYFEHLNWVGSERLHTSYNGTVAATLTALPFGDSESVTGTVWDQHDFGLLDYDGEDGTEHAQFRQYSPAQGRWVSPDPYYGSYDIFNPQSFNRYAYAYNNPVSFIDPSGLYAGQPYQCGTYDDGTPMYCMQVDTFGTGINDFGTGTNDGGDGIGPPPPFLRVMGGGGGALGNANKILQCASKLANQFSIAGVLGVNEETHPVLAAFSNAFLGNTFSGISDTITHVATGQFGAAYGDFALGGTAQGLPIGSTASSKGLAGVVTEAGVNAVTGPGSVLSGVTGVATELGEEGLAGPVGLAKLGIDGAVYLGALAYCRAHP